MSMVEHVVICRGDFYFIFFISSALILRQSWRTNQQHEKQPYQVVFLQSKYTDCSLHFYCPFLEVNTKRYAKKSMKLTLIQRRSKSEAHKKTRSQNRDIYSKVLIRRQIVSLPTLARSHLNDAIAIFGKRLTAHISWNCTKMKNKTSQRERL